MCDRFKEKFGALDKNVERIAGASMLSNMMLAVVKEEQARLELKLEEQVLRQHLVPPSSKTRPAHAEQKWHRSLLLASRAAKVEESLEELRAEQADLE